MKTFTYTITDEIGIHARPAGLLVKQAQIYNSTISAVCGEKSADLKKLFGVMGLGAKKNDVLAVSCEGDDEDEAAVKLETYLKENSY